MSARSFDCLSEPFADVAGDQSGEVVPRAHAELAARSRDVPLDRLGIDSELRSQFGSCPTGRDAQGDTLLHRGQRPGFRRSRLRPGTTDVCFASHRLEHEKGRLRGARRGLTRD